MKVIDRIKYYFERLEEVSPGQWITKYDLEKAVYEALLRGDFGTSKLGIMETVTRETRKLVKQGILEQKVEIPIGYAKKKKVAHYRLRVAEDSENAVEGQITALEVKPAWQLYFNGK